MVTLPNEYLPLDQEVESFLASEQNLYIDGEWVPAQSGKTFPTLDPSAGSLLANVAEADRADVDRAVKAARKAFDEGPWRNKLTAAERSKLIWRLADLIEQRAEVLAQLDSLDNGKPFTTARDVDVPYSAERTRRRIERRKGMACPSLASCPP